MPVLGCLLAVWTLLLAASTGYGVPGTAPRVVRAQDEASGLIAYAGTDGNIWVADPEGRAPRQVTTTGTPDQPFTDPRWSPDGTTLAFARGRSDSTIEDDGVFLSRDGTVSQIPGVTGCGHPTFLPDGKHLIYACGLVGSPLGMNDAPSADEMLTNPMFGFISISGLDGSDWRVLAPYVEGGADTDLGFPEWYRATRPQVSRISAVADDGRALLSIPEEFPQGAVSLWTLDTTTGTLARFEPPMPEPTVYRDAELVDGGARVLAMRCRGSCTKGSAAGYWIGDIVTMEPNGATVDAILTLPEGRAAAPALDPTGQWIAYEYPYGRGPAVWVASVPEGEPHVVAAGSDPAWRPAAGEFAMPGKSTQPSTGVPMYRVGAAGAGAQPGSAPLDAPDIQWRLALGSEPAGQPVFINGVMYLNANDGSVRAIDPNRGEERWASPESSMRAVGAPAVSDEAVMSMSIWPGSAGFGTVKAFDKASGEKLWEFDVRGDGTLVGSPIMDWDTVFVATSGGHLYGLAPSQGTETWRFDVGFGVTASPAIAGDTVFVPSADGVLHAIEAFSDTEKWRFSTGTVQPLTAPTVIDAAVVVGGADGFVYAMDFETGKELWRFDTGGAVLADPIAANGAVYVGSDNGSLYALDAADGTKRWEVDAGSAVRTTPSATADTVVFGTMDGVLHAVDAETGDARWQFETNHYAITSVVIVDGVVYFGSGDGSLYAIGEP